MYIDRKHCIGPTFSKAEFALMKRNLAEQKGLATLADLLGIAGNIQRLKILYHLHAHKEMSVCAIAKVLGLTDSALPALAVQSLSHTIGHGFLAC